MRSKKKTGGYFLEIPPHSYHKCLIERGRAVVIFVFSEVGEIRRVIKVRCITHCSYDVVILSVTSKQIV